MPEGTVVAERRSEFYIEMVRNPEAAKATAKFQAIASAIARRVRTDDIAAIFGVSRTEIAEVARLSGERPGMDLQSMAPDDVSNLYALLYAAQLEIESLRHQLEEGD